MYFSRVRVDLNGLCRRDLFDVMGARPYAMHQLLWRLFPGHTGPRPFLFRQETEEGNDEAGKMRGLPLFYVLSDRAPAESDKLLAVESKPFSPKIGEGDRLAFRLRANPTVARRVEGAKHSRRSDVLMHAKTCFPEEERASIECKTAMDSAAVAWLTRQGEHKGFVVEGTPEVTGYRQHVLEGRRRSRPIRFSSVDYTGTLEVSNVDAFAASLRTGVGRSKAFGFGLMMVRRV